MPLLETKGAASAQGFGLTTTTVPANYIEDVFSTWLYNGNNSTNTITNGIDLSTNGGFVWIKGRQIDNHVLFDTARGTTKYLQSNLIDAQQTAATSLTSFNTNGFTLGADSGFGWNWSGGNFVSWTFRKQPKFFDVVTYTGNGSAGRTVAHNLGSVPGCIIIKRTDTSTTAWNVYHTGLGNTKYLTLQTTDGETAASNVWNNTSPTSTVFTVGTSNAVNANGGTYVAYLFAHNAGGFGLTGTDNVISCGSYTTASDGSFEVNLGWEPQFLIRKASSTTSNWMMMDTMRGFYGGGGYGVALRANTSGAEVDGSSTDPRLNITSTGFLGFANDGGSVGNATYIYIAIRRGPMKTPTTGTSVFSPNASSGANGTQVSTNFPIDLQIAKTRASSDSLMPFVTDRLRGVTTVDTPEYYPVLVTSSSAAERSDIYVSREWNNVGFDVPPYTGGTASIYWNFRRAPGFFDEVCYTGTGGTGSRSLTHNLGAAPEFIILKRRDSTGNWATGSMFTSTTVTRALLNRNDDQDLNSLYSGQSIWGGQPTSSAFLVDASGAYNTSAATYVAYLFATVAGVSKVGTYTGTGALQTVNCGFTGGARFVLIRRANATGDWFVYDSARGISSGNDPYLLLNSTAAEVTGTNYVDTTSVGFQVTAAAPAGLNASGSTYIFLAIA